MILRYLEKAGMIDGNIMTVTGKSLGENLDRWASDNKHIKSWEGQDIIRPIDNPIKATGHIRFVPFSPCVTLVSDEDLNRVLQHPSRKPRTRRSRLQNHRKGGTSLHW